VPIEAKPFNAGPEAVEALFSEAIDASFIGPNPAINAFARSKGEAIRIVAGSTSGGAFLVVRAGIDGVEDLRGAKLATPQLGNTQDVALRAWLADHGFTTTPEGGGDVQIVPQGNSATLEAFIAGEIDGAWVPEPWATRLVLEGGGHVLVDERDLWPGGRYVTTHLIVRTAYLRQYPDTVRALIRAEHDAIELIETDPARARQLVSEQIREVTGSSLRSDVLEAAWGNLTFTLDPIASSLHESAADAARLGLMDPVDLDGIYDLALLNEVLAQEGEPPVAAE
jgi:NitT/TauT family transport system substrate-binding protein